MKTLDRATWAVLELQADLEKMGKDYNRDLNKVVKRKLNQPNPPKLNKAQQKILTQLVPTLEHVSDERLVEAVEAILLEVLDAKL